jgi:hypothetical protein
MPRKHTLLDKWISTPHLSSYRVLDTKYRPRSQPFTI